MQMLDLGFVFEHLDETFEVRLLQSSRLETLLQRSFFEMIISVIEVLLKDTSSEQHPQQDVLLVQKARPSLVKEDVVLILAAECRSWQALNPHHD